MAQRRYQACRRLWAKTARRDFRPNLVFRPFLARHERVPRSELGFHGEPTLDTFFYHLTTDEEGDVTVDDYQSTVEPTGLVQSPVAADATHMYDVTSFVQQDVMAGFAFTSYQGRVDEAADTEFRRGVEYFSLALDPAVNDDPALRPRLVMNYADIPEPATVVMLGCGLAILAVTRRRLQRQ